MKTLKIFADGSSILEESDNPCAQFAGMDLQIERDYCYCPNHGVFKEDHTQHLAGRIVFKESKGYREGLCPKCRKVQSLS